MGLRGRGPLLRRRRHRRSPSVGDAEQQSKLPRALHRRRRRCSRFRLSDRSSRGRCSATFDAEDQSATPVGRRLRAQWRREVAGAARSRPAGCSSSRAGARGRSPRPGHRRSRASGSSPSRSPAMGVRTAGTDCSAVSRRTSRWARLRPGRRRRGRGHCPGMPSTARAWRSMHLKRAAAGRPSWIYLIPVRERASRRSGEPITRSPRPLPSPISEHGDRARGACASTTLPRGGAGRSAEGRSPVRRAIARQLCSDAACRSNSERRYETAGRLRLRQRSYPVERWYRDLLAMPAA